MGANYSSGRFDLVEANKLKKETVGKVIVVWFLFLLISGVVDAFVSFEPRMRGCAELVKTVDNKVATEELSRCVYYLATPNMYFYNCVWGLLLVLFLLVGIPVLVFAVLIHEGAFDEEKFF